MLNSCFPQGMGLHRGSAKPARLIECHLNISIQLWRFQEDLIAQAQCQSNKFTCHLVSMPACIVARASTLFSKNLLNSAWSFWWKVLKFMVSLCSDPNFVDFSYTLFMHFSGTWQLFQWDLFCQGTYRKWEITWVVDEVEGMTKWLHYLLLFWCKLREFTQH